MDNFQLIYEQLQKRYQGRFLIGVREVAEIFDVAPRTVYNATHRKTRKNFPVQPVSGPGKKFRVIDCARALAEM